MLRIEAQEPGRGSSATPVAALIGKGEHQVQIEVVEARVASGPDGALDLAAPMDPAQGDKVGVDESSGRRAKRD